MDEDIDKEAELAALGFLMEDEEEEVDPAADGSTSSPSVTIVIGGQPSRGY